MKFNLFLSCNNDAFGPEEDERGPIITETTKTEVARILRQAADRVESGDIGMYYRTLYDVNGNDVGRAAFKRDDYE